MRICMCIWFEFVNDSAICHVVGTDGRSIEIFSEEQNVDLK